MNIFKNLLIIFIFTTLLCIAIYYTCNKIAKFCLIYNLNLKLVSKTSKTQNNTYIVNIYYSFKNYSFQFLLPYSFVKTCSYKELKDILNKIINTENKIKYIE